MMCDQQSSSRSELPTFYGLPLLDDDGELRLVSKRDLRELRMPRRGAFTGGFSAGFYNTVSTKSGFEPQSFFSTRSQKVEARQDVVREPEDFMDSEDFGVHGIAHKFLRASSELSVAYDKSSGLTASSKSLKLLEMLGWKRGQGVGPMIPITARQPLVPAEFRHATVAPINASESVFTAKTDRHGIGYSGLLSKTHPKIQGRDTNAKSVSSLPRGHAFGVGVLNESDDEMDAIAFGHDCMPEPPNRQRKKFATADLPEKLHSIECL